MQYSLWTRYNPCMVRVRVRTPKPTKIRLIGSDKSQANTKFIDAAHIINGEQDLFIRMPMSPNVLLIDVYNQDIGNKAKGQDTSFEVVGIRNEELQITLGRTQMDTPIVKNFVSFAQRFSYNAGWLPPKDYYSASRQFKIEYMPVIKSMKGEVLTTPARISTQNGRIQLSQEAFVPFTIPMRMAILLHEFSHYYVNSDIADEVEADLNALTIYLGLGYPIKEGYAAFGETFMDAPTQLNKNRYEIINTFIKDYIAEHKIQDVYAKGN
ncbi:MAG: hypothetical protein ACOVNU_09125 [Candidatus Kapaibacteriota bacterium]